MKLVLVVMFNCLRLIHDMIFSWFINEVCACLFNLSGLKFFWLYFFFCHLQRAWHEDQKITEMVDKMKDKFDRYWSDYCDVLALGTILDPRYKMSFLKFFYIKLGFSEVSCQAK